MWQQKWVMGNWKMNGRQAANAALLSALRALPASDALVGVAVPAVYITQAATALADSAVWVGAQDVSGFGDNGAYTGEISAAMLADAGAQFVLLGHSERRQYFGEDNVLLQTKWQHAVAAGLVPILCVGETLMQREAGEAEAVVAEQLSLLAALKADTVAVAYEPVWAIGTGQVATVAQIGDMHGFIYRQILSLCGEGAKIRVLYGGSVNAENAAAILAVPGVDGALVGGASLQAAAFATIIDAAQPASRLAV